MAQTVSIESWVAEIQTPEWVEEMLGDPNATLPQIYQDCLKTILSEMMNGRRISSYSEYVPWMNLDISPHNRGIIGKVLYFIWCKCQSLLLPEMNFMVVRKREGVPGKSLRMEWEKHYHSIDGYETYCLTRARESVRFLDNNWVRIVP